MYGVSPYMNETTEILNWQSEYPYVVLCVPLNNYGRCAIYHMNCICMQPSQSCPKDGLSSTDRWHPSPPSLFCMSFSFLTPRPCYIGQTFLSNVMRLLWSCPSYFQSGRCCTIETQWHDVPNICLYLRDS